MIKIENENSLRAALSNGVNLFLGAGFSVLARNGLNESIPVGGELKAKLVHRFAMHTAERLDLSQICTIIGASRAKELRSFFEEVFKVISYDKLYAQLDHFSLQYVFTTNIDNLLHRVFSETSFHYLNDVSLKGPARFDKSAINYVPLHGTVENAESSLAFATTDIASAFAADPDLWHLLTNQMQRLPTVFWGYSLTDAGILQALNPGTVRRRDLKERWIVLREPDAAAEEYFKALQFNIIVADTQDFLGYLESLPIATQSLPPTEPTEKLFPEEAIPSLGIGPVRPLLDFYLGEAPTWADIFSGRLHKTKHYFAVENLIHGRRNAVVIGIPACGKTTLLMQCAAGVDFSGHKLVARPLTLEKAKHVLAKLGGSNALLFVDDFAESVEALAYLMQHTNITTIAFDREHNYEIVSHKLDRGRFEVLDVTELNSIDVQSIFDRIPQEIRRPTIQQIQTQQGVQVSLFELVEANILRPTLKRRFAQVLTQLANDPDLLDLLVMVAYVHSCRTPVSFDMAYAFLRDRVTKFQEVYDRIDKLGQLLSSYSGALLDGDQDHYVPRSVIVSEAIMDQVPIKSFRRVLERFHKEISPLRICRFDVFKRRAFDSEFFAKAFPNAAEGKEFYDEIYLRDPSPYLKQQGALYLAQKKRFHEAFAWIDEALLQSNGRIPSIRHTHAIILFNANIGVASTGGDSVRSLLDQSMTILTECYKYDQRKSYHAVTFGDQALKYADVYWDSTAVIYLQTAATWLEEELKGAPWHRRIRYLLTKVKGTLLRAREN